MKWHHLPQRGTTLTDIENAAEMESAYINSLKGLTFAPADNRKALAYHNFSQHLFRIMKEAISALLKYTFRERYVYCIVVIIFNIADTLDFFVRTIFDIVCHCHQLHRLVSAPMLYVGIPPNPLNTNIFLPLVVNSPSGSLQWIGVGNTKLSVSRTYGRPEPHFIVHYQRKHFCKSNRIEVAQY